MRMLLRPIVLGACLLGPGCQFVCEAARNIVREPLTACDEKAMRHRAVKLGKQAWNQMVRQYGESFSCDYRAGFVDGFADYLIYGGCIGTGGCCAGGSCGGAQPSNVLPTTGMTPKTDISTDNPSGDGGPGYKEYPVCPAVPPERYRRKRFMTPEGYAAIEDWYAGFKHGAATAMASGLRNLVVIPVQCPPAFGPEDGSQPVVSNRPTGPSGGPKETVPPMPPPNEITPPGSTTLPQPRSADSGSTPEPMPPAAPSDAPPGS